MLEYKLFEPSFYITDVPDWGTALLHCVVVKAGAIGAGGGVGFMLDQCHNIEPKIPAQIRSG